MKYSIIITAWKESETIALNIKNILNPASENLLPEMEIIVVSPDEETFLAAKSSATTFNFSQIKWVKDQAQGKPKALNLGIAESSSPILIFMDGDILIGKNALKPLIAFINEETWLVSGRPVSADTKDTMLGYWGNLLADAAHSKRLREAKKNSSYFVSGYLYALKKFENLQFPENTLVDDGWISLKVLELGKKIGYSPDSLVYIKYPKNLSDWFKQKRRSAGGYSQLSVSSVRSSLPSSGQAVKKPRRSFVEEFKYLFFPIVYARSLKQLWFSLLLYPIRLVLWIVILFDKITGKQNQKLWVRIESTK